MTGRGIGSSRAIVSSSVPAAGQRVSRYDDVPGTLLDGLPAQALIVRAAGGHGAVTRGITDPGALRSAIATAAANSPTAWPDQRPDLRARTTIRSGD